MPSDPTVPRPGMSLDDFIKTKGKAPPVVVDALRAASEAFGGDDPTTPRLPEKLELVPFDGHPVTRWWLFDPDANNIVGIANFEDVGSTIVSRYNAHPAYARAAEALREAIEADTYGKSHYLLALEGGDVEAADAMNKRMDDAWASARAALAALKEVG